MIAAREVAMSALLAPALAPALALALALLLSPARADTVEPVEDTPTSVAAPPEPEPPSQTLQEVWASMQPQSLLDAALRHRSLGNIQGARERLQVLDEGGQLPALSLYHLSVCDELDEDYAAAQAGYETLILRWPDLDLADDARYRRAIVLEDLGEHGEAAKQIKELQHRGKWEERDERSMALVRGAAEVRGGKERRGIRRIDKALAALDGSEDLAWARARGRFALAEAQLEAAQAVEIRNDRKAKKRLVERAQLLEAAQEQVIAIAQLGEPEYALHGLLALGDAYLALHDDMVAAPPPKKLDADQVAIYQAELTQQVDVLQVKAWRYYDEGVSLATRLQWQGGITGALRERRDALRE